MNEQKTYSNSNDEYTVLELFEEFKNDETWEPDPQKRAMLLGMMFEIMKL